ncbi:4-hydroxyphenylpyruvate dioxygenase [Edaphobacter modestus]|uniref:4-hydroxyphenylpyruvate dioxygenase n=1 Tax=Edaphobacter modestus TaxID=388466 RepID=A0A4Q7YQC6_9BACT|nr:4-hydroxyphenylpyruvate dioxygenase [Edaphobacter modestus]RZU39071.1 4-hydroxyphenylpyruvate dioxygenase [Edaphobacter modestus]
MRTASIASEPTRPSAKTSTDFLPLKGIDHVEFYVGNARQAAYFYRAAFGMSLVSYAGPETGQRDRTSYVVQQGKIRFVLTTPLRSGNPIADHVHRHGDAVHRIALWVDDARNAWQETVDRGAISIAEPYTLSDERGHAVLSSIRTYGDTIHTFVERRAYSGPFLPGFRAIEDDPIVRPVGLLHIDHMVGNVGWHEMDTWVDFYAKVMGFSLYQHFDDKDISTEYSALMSKVMANGNGYVKFPINEPAEGKRRSQIEEYLDFHAGPGVQHIAMATNNIVHTVNKLQEQGIEFLRVPHSYYSELQARVGKIDEPVEELERLGILVDRDDEGYMLQIFTRPVEDRPTLFFEIIQRKGSRSFGKGNFKALFEAIEREQQARGNM